MLILCCPFLDSNQGRFHTLSLTMKKTTQCQLTRLYMEDTWCMLELCSSNKTLKTQMYLPLNVPICLCSVLNWGGSRSLGETIKLRTWEFMKSWWMRNTIWKLSIWENYQKPKEWRTLISWTADQWGSCLFKSISLLNRFYLQHGFLGMKTLCSLLLQM